MAMDKLRWRLGLEKRHRKLEDHCGTTGTSSRIQEESLKVIYFENVFAIGLDW